VLDCSHCPAVPDHIPSCCATVRSIALEIVQIVLFRVHDAQSLSFAHRALHAFAVGAVCVRTVDDGLHSFAQLPTGVHVLAIPRSENVGEVSMKSSATAFALPLGFCATSVSATAGTPDAEAFHILNGV